jgi:hypothetical protein
MEPEVGGRIFICDVETLDEYGVVTAPDRLSRGPARERRGGLRR